MNMNYTYLVECADGTLYCGWTNHLEARMEAHNAGRGAKYTKSRRPVVLVYYETFATKQEAMQREYAVKQLTRSEKQALIAGGTTRAAGQGGATETSAAAGQIRAEQADVATQADTAEQTGESERAYASDQKDTEE